MSFTDTINVPTFFSFLTTYLVFHSIHSVAISAHLVFLCPLNRRRITPVTCLCVTSTTMKGKFVTSNYSGSIAKANYKCNSLAEYGSDLLDGRYFKAWLSMRNYWPAQNFTDCPPQWLLFTWQNENHYKLD